MDQERTWPMDVPDLDLPLDDGTGGDGIEPPDDTGGGGGGRSGPGAPQADPFMHSRWAALVPALIMLVFGAQSVLVVWVSRAGLGSETIAWGLATLFIVMFTTVFIAGARFIGRYRR